ncbi:lysozyme g-like protein 1 [Anomaloglossus baeobatrachus]|uniref:lysozyme g-like protein 1 n=1 Tax=Anomaloglossus baeobatrachus TaxID=238106 RepID=UPI003F4FA7A4
MASRYGNLYNISTTGASVTTGRQDGENISGIDASEKLARTDLGRMSKYKETIQSVSSETGIDGAIIAGTISRESRAGNVLDSRKCGDHGNAFGLMQIDKRHHTLRGDWNSENPRDWNTKVHILQGTEILASMFTAIGKKFPGFTKEEQMKGALAAYNAGPGNVTNLHDPDSRTTGKDYANDVIGRAKFYKRQGY